MTIINIYLITLNIISFIIMGIDKILAIKFKKRVNEHTLLTLSVFGGCYGTFLAMIIFNHKIRKAKFFITIPILTIIITIILITIKIQNT